MLFGFTKLHRNIIFEEQDITNLRTVISFSLYGNVTKYFQGLIENCKTINQSYPDFWIYVYLGNDFDRSILEGKFNEFKNLLFIETGKSGHEVMSHRFFSIDRPEVGIAFSRDLDSQVNLRDQYCINTFISSPKQFQIIRDNPVHATEILGGMWGIKKGLSSKIQDLFNDFKMHNPVIKHGTDQIFLSKYIYPYVKYHAIVFDEYFHYLKESPQKIVAPVIYFPQTNGYDYVGRVVPLWGEMYEIM